MTATPGIDDLDQVGAAPRRGGRVFAMVRSAVLWIVAAVGLLCIVVFGLSLIFGIRAQIVVSGSMEPTVPTGSLILAQPVTADQIMVGDVVTVPRPDVGGLVTHRVVKVEHADGHAVLTLRGDANASDDPTTYTVSSAGRMLVVIPGLGYLAATARTPIGMIGLGLIAIVVLAIYFAGGRRTDEEEA